MSEWKQSFVKARPPWSLDSIELQNRIRANHMRHIALAEWRRSTSLLGFSEISACRSFLLSSFFSSRCSRTSNWKSKKIIDREHNERHYKNIARSTFHFNTDKNMAFQWERFFRERRAYTSYSNILKSGFIHSKK